MDKDSTGVKDSTVGVLMVGICVCCSGTQYISCKYGARLQPDKPLLFTVDGDPSCSFVAV